MVKQKVNSKHVLVRNVSHIIYTWHITNWTYEIHLMTHRLEVRLQRIKKINAYEACPQKRTMSHQGYVINGDDICFTLWVMLNWFLVHYENKKQYSCSRRLIRPFFQTYNSTYRWKYYDGGNNERSEWHYRCLFHNK